jgi:hypothetical protein
MKVKFEFGHGQIIFFSVIPIDDFFLVSVHTIPNIIYAFNLTNGYVKGMRSSSYDLVMVR